MTKNRKNKLYRIVRPSIWRAGGFKALPDSAKLLWLYLLTGPLTTSIPGLLVGGERAMAEQLGWGLGKFRKAFSQLNGRGIARADWAADLVFLPEAIADNQPASPDAVKGWRHFWAEVPDCALKTEAHQILRDHCQQRNEGFLHAFDEACGIPEGDDNNHGHGGRHGGRHGVEHQEQEQEQEQEQGTGTGTGTATRVGVGVGAGAEKQEKEKEQQSPPSAALVLALSGSPQSSQTTVMPVSAQNLLGHFDEKWQERYGIAYVRSNVAVEMKHAKKLLESADLEAYPVVERYLEDEEPFLVEQRHAFRFLYGNVNRYRQVLRNGQPMSRRMRAIVESSKKFLQIREQKRLGLSEEDKRMELLFGKKVSW